MTLVRQKLARKCQGNRIEPLTRVGDRVAKEDQSLVIRMVGVDFLTVVDVEFVTSIGEFVDCGHTHLVEES